MQVIRPLLLFIVFAWSQTIDIYDSGGPLMPEQAAYDVTFYDLNLEVSPEDSSISGFVTIDAKIVQPIDYFVVDLDTLLKIEKVVEWQNNQQLTRVYQREIGKIWIELKTTRQAGETVSIEIFYGGQPLIAERPPWSSGFTWARTADNQPWISTTCQGEGPDIWWPVKDHVSDEPDSMGIHITVPDPLICASNGHLRSVEKHTNQKSTFHWFVSTPINNYDVALNIAPYRVIKEKYTNPYGESYPFMFWVLPQDYENGLAIMPEFMEHMYFFEELLGPYPFRADKYGVAQTPHLGMEHQTIIAYGAKFDNSSMTGKDWGFDALHHHELAHEWWGNMVTNADWKDAWLHEGFATYMQALYMEKLQGAEGYHSYINARQFTNEYAIAPKKSQTASEIWNGPPIYSKGAAVLHSLRYLIGYENLKKALRRMLYPTPDLEKVTDGSHTRFVTTNDFKYIAEKVSGMDLDWFFDVYVHQPDLPMLVSRLKDDVLYLSWKTAQNMPFPMPIDIRMGENIKRYEINESGIKVKIDRDKAFEIDPEKWVLFDLAGLKEAQTYLENKQYDQARMIYDKMLFITPENVIIAQMLEHVQYALQNREKIDGNFYDSYLVSYISARGRDYSFIKDDKHFYMISKRGKYKIYPIADNTFTFEDFDGRLTFDIDPIKKKKQFKFNMGNMIIHGEEVTE